MEFTYSREQEMVKKMLKEFAENEIAPISAEIDEKAEYPYAVSYTHLDVYKRQYIYKNNKDEYLYINESVEDKFSHQIDNEDCEISTETILDMEAVSYTHLDVYKRQERGIADDCWHSCNGGAAGACLCDTARERQFSLWNALRCGGGRSRHDGASVQALQGIAGNRA